MMLFAVVMGSVVLSSCGDDENNNEIGNNTERSLVGKWKSVSFDEEGYVIFEFKSNGSGKFTEGFPNGNEYDEEFTWTYSSETCRLYVSFDGDVESIDVEWLKKDRIKLKGVVFERQ